MKYTISYESDPRHEDIQVLYDGLKDHMIAKRDLKPISFFGCFIKAPNDKMPCYTKHGKIL